MLKINMSESEVGLHTHTGASLCDAHTETCITLKVMLLKIMNVNLDTRTHTHAEGPFRAPDPGSMWTQNLPAIKPLR